jgi:hypothetical protein
MGLGVMIWRIDIWQLIGRGKKLVTAATKMRSKILKIMHHFYRSLTGHLNSDLMLFLI